jgi:hypothetical protein
MQEKRIKSFFKEQVKVILQRSAEEPEGFRAYFAGRAPRDEEILGILAVNTMMSGEFHMGDSFPTPLEALAALSGSGRIEICKQFRRELKHCLSEICAG